MKSFEAPADPIWAKAVDALQLDRHSKSQPVSFDKGDGAPSVDPPVSFDKGVGAPSADPLVSFDKGEGGLLRSSPKISFVDTEFVGSFLFQVGIVDEVGRVRLNVIIDHGMSCDEMITHSKSLFEGQGLSLHMARSSIYKLYGPDSKFSKLPHVNADQLADMFDALNIAEAIWCEYSTSGCDHSVVSKLLGPVGRLLSMPSRVNSMYLCAILLCHFKLRSKACVKLEVLFSTLFPSSELCADHHNAQDDALKLRKVFLFVVGLFSS